MRTERETERLVLRRFTLDDAQSWLPLISLPDIIRYTGDSPGATIEAARETLRTRPLHDYEVHGYGRMACIEKASGRLVGFCGLKYVDGLNETDIGYRFLPECWGKGYATESARVVMEYGLRELGLPRIVGTVYPENTGSVRVLEKLGMAFVRPLEPEPDGRQMHLYATR